MLIKISKKLRFHCPSPPSLSPVIPTPFPTKKVNEQRANGSLFYLKHKKYLLHANSKKRGFFWNDGKKSCALHLSLCGFFYVLFPLTPIYFTGWNFYRSKENKMECEQKRKLSIMKLKQLKSTTKFMEAFRGKGRVRPIG